jgi:hypothetical protein
MRALLRKGNRLFTATCVWTLLVAIGHTTTILQPLPDDEALQSTVDSMRAYTFDVADGIEPSLYQVFVGVWIEVGLLLVGLALLNCVALAAAGGDPRTKRALLMANLVLFAPLTALFIFIPIPPPLISFASITVLLVIDLELSRPKVSHPATA